jgi:uncharacterized protein (TIGR00369 family)
MSDEQAGEPIALYRARSCFGCGTDNPGGLGLAPQRTGNRVYATFTPRMEHRGYARAIHGGITCSLLDELCGLACSQRVDGKCATVELTVRFRRPLLVGVPLTVEARFLRRHGKLLLAAGRIIDDAGTVLATAHGKFATLDEKQLGRFIEQ